MFPVDGNGEYGTGFCSHGTNFIAGWSDRGTFLISGREVVSVAIGWEMSTGVVAVQALRICLTCRSSLQKPWQVNLPLLSVLCLGLVNCHDGFTMSIESSSFIRQVCSPGLKVQVKGLIFL